MKQIIGIGLLVLWVFGGYAQTLEGYLQTAAENNPGLKAQYYRYQASLERVPQAGSLPDPEMGFNFFIMPMERYMGEQVGDISIMQMFPWFGSLKAGKEEASYMAKMEFERFTEAKIELFFQVRSLWYQLYQVDKEAALLEEELELMHQLKNLALAKFKSSPSQAGATSGGNPSGARPASKREGNASDAGAGMSGMATGRAGQPGGQMAMSSGGNAAMGSMQSSSGGMVDVLLVQLQIKELESKMTILKKSAKPLRIAFNKLLNREIAAEIVVKDTLEPAQLPASLSLVEDAAIQNHPMVKMAEWDEKAREAQERMAKLMGRPMIGLGLNYMLLQPRMTGANEMAPMNNGNNMLMPMATVTIPIYRKKYKAQRMEAEYQREAATRDRESAANQLVSELGQLVNTYEEATINMELITEQIAITEQAIRLMTTSYQVGRTSMEELMRQRQNLLRYREQILTTLTNQHKTVAAINKTMAVDN
ncbi:TolC family protein [Parapedobacter tibetensis]|uniref:TolC family protein n=1 Tax=Parapedobacter tibetensis TaxID=2972951 RepID=UPI00214DBEFE|nr:TolC family protein [Parapedobacter tibetensis]